MSCEKNCALFHSCGVCAHTVAVAKKKGCLDSLVKWLSNRDNLNVTELANSGLPKGAGKKGGTKREFSTKSSTKIVKRMLENVSDNVFTPRTGIITKSTMVDANAACIATNPASRPPDNIALLEAMHLFLVASCYY